MVVTVARGFIAGSLARSFQEKASTRIRAVDKKPLPDWAKYLTAWKTSAST